MKKPYKPPRPKLNEPEPPSSVWKQTYLFAYDYNNSNKLFLLEDYREDENWEVVFADRIDLNEFRQINNLIEIIIQRDSAIDIKLSVPNYENSLQLTLKVEKPKDEYQKELDNYNKRFERYSVRLTEYEKELLEWEKWSKQKKIEQLQKEIEKLR